MRRALLAALFALAACGGGGTTTATCDDDAFERARAAGAGGTEVTVCGTVAAAGRPRLTRSGHHLPFVVAFPDRTRVTVDANLDELGPLAVHPGQRVEVRGEYYTDPGGRDGIHWVHHTSRGTHPSGYVTLDGVTYR